jgi:hypothetical protein
MPHRWVVCVCVGRVLLCIFGCDFGGIEKEKGMRKKRDVDVGVCTVRVWSSLMYLLDAILTVVLPCLRFVVVACVC